MRLDPTLSRDRRAVVTLALDGHHEVEAADPGGQQGQGADRARSRSAPSSSGGSHGKNPTPTSSAIGIGAALPTSAVPRPQPRESRRASCTRRSRSGRRSRPGSRAGRRARGGPGAGCGTARRRRARPPRAASRARPGPARGSDPMNRTHDTQRAASAGSPRARWLAGQPTRLAPPRDRIGVIVMIVGAEPEEQLGFVVDADRNDWPVGGEVRPDDLGHRCVPAADPLAKRRAGVRRHRPRARWRGHPHRRTARSPCLARGLGEDVIRHAEAGQLGVDVRPGAQDDREPRRRGGVEEPRQSSLAVPRQLAALELVDPPRHVGLDQCQPLPVHRTQARRPACRGDPPVVHRAGVERQVPISVGPCDH